MNPIIHSLFKDLSGASFVPDTVLGKGEFDVNPKKLDLQGPTISWTDNFVDLFQEAPGNIFIWSYIFAKFAKVKYFNHNCLTITFFQSDISSIVFSLVSCGLGMSVVISVIH